MIRALSLAVALPLSVGAAMAAPPKARGVAEAAPAGPDAATKEAREFYESGMRLYNSTDYAQCAIEFRRSYQTKAIPASLYMMAQCEYFAGAYKEAKADFQRYLEAEQDRSSGSVDIAKARLKSIEARKSIFAINTIPDGVEVVIEAEATPGVVVEQGTAPNPFAVPPGRYTIRLSKAQYQTKTVSQAIDLGDAKPLFFTLDPISAQLDIKTKPKGARLFVNGNLVRNPYRQPVDAGRYEIHTEANNHREDDRSFDLSPGEKKEVEVELLQYQQSGHKSLWAWTATLGGVAGWFGVQAALDDPGLPQNPAATGLLIGGSAAGVVLFGFSSILAVPDYIPEKRALWVMGGEWMGAAEGLAVGLSINRGIRPAVVSGVAGFGAGTLSSWLLRERAPNFGRSAVIQSGAAVGALVGVLSAPSLSLDSKYTGPMMLAGLNLGLGTGLAMAYLPDQRRYGPTWRRAVMVDAAAGAGAMIGALVSAIQKCVGVDCTFPIKTAEDQKRTARLTLGFGLAGLAAGAFLTRNVDRAESEAFTRPTVDPPSSVSLIPSPTVLVVQDDQGRSSTIPALAAVGRF